MADFSKDVSIFVRAFVLFVVVHCFFAFDSLKSAFSISSRLQRVEALERRPSFARSGASSKRLQSFQYLERSPTSAPSSLRFLPHFASNPWSFPSKPSKPSSSIFEKPSSSKPPPPPSLFPLKWYWRCASLPLVFVPDGVGQLHVLR